MEDIDVSNGGKRWSETDSDRLKTLYRQDEWDLVKLAREFKRTPCSIWSRLKQYNIIAEPEEARGYDLYLDQYAERYAALPQTAKRVDHTENWYFGFTKRTWRKQNANTPPWFDRIFEKKKANALCKM